MKPKPSDMFLGAILRGYDKEAASGKPVSCSGIWNQVCMECMRVEVGFKRMFEWDTRKGERNRIGTIAECIRDGLVPGLELYIGAVTRQGQKGHEYVRRSQ